MIGAVVVVVLGGLFFLGKNIKVERTIGAERFTASAISAVGDKIFDFGTISMAAGPVNYIFELKNTGNNPVTVKKIYTSCMCTTAYLDGGERRVGPFGMPGHGGPSGRASETIGPGESRRLQVIFDPAAHGPAGVGKIERLVVLEDNQGGTVELTIKAVVTP